MNEEHNPLTTIFPTFQCFNDSMEFIDHVFRLCPEKIDDVVLVHAICVSTNGREFAHSWVEDTKDQLAIFSGVFMGDKIYFAAPLEEFLKTYAVKESTRYTPEEALQNNLRTINYGPWEEKYEALCGAPREHLVMGGGHMQRVIQIGALPKSNKPTTKGE